MFDPLLKVKEYKAALDAFLERVVDDSSILAVVRLGELAESTIWHWDSARIWIVQLDGVTKRLRADGDEHRLFRTFIEEDVPIHAELFERSRFRKMVEGSSRTAFRCNYFEHRKLVHCKDPSIQKWFDQAQAVATKDRDQERLMATAWLTHALRHTRRWVEIRNDHALAQQSAMWVAHALAALTIIEAGEITEEILIYRARELQPELFRVVYDDLLDNPAHPQPLAAAIDRATSYLEEQWQELLKPLLDYLRKQQRVVPLSEICDHFYATPLYPWTLESACDWLHENGHLERVSESFKITKRSKSAVEEPAYFWEE